MIQRRTGEARNDALIGHLDLVEELLDVSELLVVLLDSAGRIHLFNRACEVLTGYAASEVLGADIRERLIPADEADGVAKVIDRLKAGESPIRHANHWLTADGRRCLIEWRNTILTDADGKVEFLVATGIDATAREQAEQARQQTELQLREFVDALPCLVARIDKQERVRFANHGYREWFGLDPETQTGRHIRDIIGPDAYTILHPHFRRALSGKRAVHHGEVPYAHGGTRFVHGTYIPSYGANGEIDGLYVLAIDLTERERLRQQLAAESRRARLVLDTAVDGIITIDESGIIQSYNSAAERIFGWRAEEAIGQNVNILMPEPDHSHHDEYIRDHITTGERRIIGIGREVTGVHRDGTPIEIDLAVGEFTENGRRYFTGFTRNITDRKQAEQLARQRLGELARVTRLHAMGELASGLAHEVNQPLTAIHANAEACLALIESGNVPLDKFNEALGQIAQQSRRASNVIEQMRNFLRTRQADRVTEREPNELVHEVLPLLSHEIESRAVQVRLDLADELPAIPVNEVQVEQVIFNVLKNAIEAVEDVDGERIVTIHTRYHRGTEPACEITIDNSGPGIPEEHLAQLFDPLFSTKSDGMGQGLAISRSIAESHGGRIHAENLPDQGVRFRLLLPVKMEPLA